MERIEYRGINDRTTGAYDYDTKQMTAWPSGPWDDEPDKVQWQDEATMLPCLIVRNRLGALCGYVGVAEGHLLYGKDYDAAEDLAVHGGITFGGPCQDNDKEHGICHIAGPGEPDHVWWIGFDCSHAWDLSPAMRPLGRGHEEVYRDIAFVTAECASLAAQLKGMQP